MKIAFLGLRAIGNCSGGIERHVEELAVRMASIGHDVTIYCRAKYNETGVPIYKGVRLVNVPALYSKHLEAISHTCLTVSSVLYGFDVVHFHACGPSLLSWAPRLFGPKVVVTVHGLDFLRTKWGVCASRVLRVGAWTAVHCPHSTIVVSKVLQSHYKNHYGRNTVHIPNGVNAPVIRVPQRIQRFGLRGRDYILFLGRLVPEKGAHCLISAFKNLKTDLRLVITGGGCHTDDYTAHLQELARVDSRILFTGPLFDEDKDEIFSNAKLFVLPSELEGMPIALLEAMSYGCPVLCSAIPECLEVLENDEISWNVTDCPAPSSDLCETFPPGDAENLRKSLQRILARDDLEEMGRRGRAHVLKRYGWDEICHKTLNLYTSLLRSE